MKRLKRSKIVLIVFSFSIISIIFSTIIFIEIAVFDTKLDKNTLLIRNLAPTVLTSGGNAYESPNALLYVEYKDLPDELINAFVSIEDKEFFRHNGFSFKRTASALLTDLKTMSFAEGGSTITQQLVKNKILSSEKSIKRKLKELKLAIEVEREFSKEEIFENYVNSIYYGSGFYGVQNASLGYFDRKIDSLTLPELCILAGVVKNPRDYSPINHPENAIQRMKTVLNELYDDGKITLDELNDAMGYHYYPPIPNAKTDENIFNDSVLTSVYNECAEILGVTSDEIRSTDITICTYIDENLQRSISNIFKNSNYSVKNAEKAVILTDNSSGGIIALQSTLPMDIKAFRRSPGSTVKPLLVYTPAIEIGGYCPFSFVNDKKITVNGYSPENFGGSYLGYCTLCDAVSSSSNAVALSILRDLGVENCKNYMKKSFNIELSAKDSYASALGGLTNGLSFAEVLKGYATLAENGKNKEITLIKSIFDSKGNILYEHSPSSKQTIRAESAYLVSSMLRENTLSGTAKSMSDIPYSIYSKTGTVGNKNGNSDAYNLSYTSKNTMLVWYGTVDGRKTLPSTLGGGGYPTTLAGEIYDNVLPKAKPISIPKGIVKRKIDIYMSKKMRKLYLASIFTPKNHQIEGVFDIKNAPKSYYSYFRSDYLYGFLDS